MRDGPFKVVFDPDCPPGHVYFINPNMLDDRSKQYFLGLVAAEDEAGET